LLTKEDYVPETSKLGRSSDQSDQEDSNKHKKTSKFAQKLKFEQVPSKKLDMTPKSRTVVRDSLENSGMQDFSSTLQGQLAQATSFTFGDKQMAQSRNFMIRRKYSTDGLQKQLLRSSSTASSKRGNSTDSHQPAIDSEALKLWREIFPHINELDYVISKNIRMFVYSNIDTERRFLCIVEAKKDLMAEREKNKLAHLYGQKVVKHYNSGKRFQFMSSFARNKRLFEILDRFSRDRYAETTAKTSSM